MPTPLPSLCLSCPLHQRANHFPSLICSGLLSLVNFPPLLAEHHFPDLKKDLVWIPIALLLLLHPGWSDSSTWANLKQSTNQIISNLSISSFSNFFSLSSQLYILMFTFRHFQPQGWGWAWHSKTRAFDGRPRECMGEPESTEAKMCKKLTIITQKETTAEDAIC